MSGLNHIFKIFLFSIFIISGCQKNTPEIRQQNSLLRPLTNEEKLADFDYLVTLIKANYAPLEYKEQRLQFKFDQLVSEYKKEIIQAKSNADVFGVFRKFLTHLQDGHVSLTPGVGLGEYYVLDFEVESVEDKMFVTSIVNPEVAHNLGIEVGDEVLDIDGLNKEQALKIILKYHTKGNKKSDQSYIYFIAKRYDYLKELIPKNPQATVRFRKKNGIIFTRASTWTKRTNLNELKSEIVQPVNHIDLINSRNDKKINLSLGKDSVKTNDENTTLVNSFFINSTTISNFGLVQVNPSLELLKSNKFNFKKEIINNAAYIYRYNNKNILLVRMSSFNDVNYENAIIWYQTLLQQFEVMIDVLVIDETNNFGGYAKYATDFVSLFANNHTRGLMAFLKADRKHMNHYYDLYLEAQEKQPEVSKNTVMTYKLIEDAYNNGQPLTKIPVPLENNAGNYIIPYNENWSFKKPVLILANEKSMSSADIFPMLMKENQLATIMGTRTAGLGGNVEPVGTLPYSQIQLNLTRSLLVTYNENNHYHMNDILENKGVEPDMQRELKLTDVQNKYVDYLKDVSEAAVQLTNSPKQP